MANSLNKNIIKGNNKRLTNKEPTNNEATAAWSNDEKLEEKTKVNIPSDYSVNKAKTGLIMEVELERKVRIRICQN